MFIGGLHLSTEVESLKEYFSKWGVIVDAVVMTDGATRRSRGFGFVTYNCSQSVDDCLAAKPHNIDGKDVRKQHIHATLLNKLAFSFHVTRLCFHMCSVVLLWADSKCVALSYN